MMRIRFTLLTLAFLWMFCLLIGMAQAQESDAQQQANIEAMLRLADQAQLSQSAEWRKINLYHSVWGKVESRVDDLSYFYSSNGKHDPQVELEATIRAAYDEGMSAQSRQPNVCRWVARYQFLSRRMKALGFDYAPPRCEGFERWKSGIATDRLTLIFASIYLNSPASMYGHAFLRFDNAKPGEFNRLNDATIGYSVNGDIQMGVTFLTRSLFGGFPGTFVFVPYYMKLREYADLENRDLWEYQTDFTPDEIDKMLAFIWEQSFTYLDYYFFDDNCALMLLAILEAGRPRLNLIENAKPWLIPLDSVKQIQRSGLVAKKHYRPSQYSTLAWNDERGNVAIREQAITLADSLQVPSVLPGANPSEQAKILDLTMGILEYQRNQKSEQDAAPLNQFQLQLSGVRSRIDTPSSYVSAPTPRESPDEGHDSLRIGIAQGRVGSGNYAQLNLRGGYHDSLDPQVGFAPGSSSKMGDLYLRLNAKQIRFERLDMFDVFMPSVRTAWYRPLTLKINASIRREVQQNDMLSPTALRIELAAGEGYRISEHSQVFVMADGITRLASASNLALGPVAGWLWTPQERMRGELNAGAFWMAAGRQRYSWLYRVSGGMAWDVYNNQNNIRINVSRQWMGNGGNAANSYTDIQLAYFHYL